MVDTKEEQALRQLRSEMLEFVMAELELRVVEGNVPKLSNALIGQLRQQIGVSVAEAMADVRRAEAADIAAHLADHWTGSGPKPTKQPKQSADVKGRRKWLSYFDLKTALIVLLALAVIVLGYLAFGYRDDIARLNRITAIRAEQDQGATSLIRQACRNQERVNDQLRGLTDTRFFTDSCAQGRRGREQNAMCSAVSQIDQLSITQECMTWQASQ